MWRASCRELRAVGSWSARRITTRSVIARSATVCAAATYVWRRSARSCRPAPLLFQGEEYDESHPFQYFTDHIDPEIADKTRSGRRREFAEFSDFKEEQIPDPEDPRTFLRSRLDPATGDPEHLAYDKELLSLRRRLPSGPAHVEVDEERRLLRFYRGEAELVANFSDQEQDGVPAAAARSGSDRRRRRSRSDASHIPAAAHR